MAINRKRKLSKKEEKAAKRTEAFGEAYKNNSAQSARVATVSQTKRVVELPEIITVKDFADKAGLSVVQVITVLMKSGVLATINQTIDFETASIVGDDLGVEIVPEAATKETAIKGKVNEQGAPENLVTRPPVVTIMGHVDHGKTTLLDKIRATKVVEGESGGITQHISAYQIVLSEAKNKDLKGRKITFIDTPGHAAFSAMREHGTAITDIVVLIVAANDGVMPQTAEVIGRAKENNVPIIVAINKVDLPDADVMKVKQQLSEYDLLPEEWGGKTVMVEISAKTGKGVDELLEMIVLQADLMNLKADPAAKAVGVVIESNLQKGEGALAVVLIENGTIHASDPIAVGSTYGRVRILEDFAKRRIPEAGPSTPVRIAGLKSLPSFGERLMAFDTEKEAKEAAVRSQGTSSTLNIATAKRITGSSYEENGQQAKTIEYNVVVKSDVAGSLEAIKKLISEIDSKEVLIKVISEGVGPVSESDVTLAKATNAEVLGFRVPVLMAAKKIAENEDISLKQFEVIYKLIDDIKATASSMLPPEIIEDELGRMDVLAIFRDDKKAFVAGGKVKTGRLAIGDEIKVLQAGNDKHHNKIASLRQGKNEVKECDSGIECGVAMAPGANVAVGDTIVAYKQTEKARIIE